MKKKICAVLLSLCSLIGGAERKSDASIIGKTLKYSSAAVVATVHLVALALSALACKSKNHIDSLGPQFAESIPPYVGNYLKDNFCYKLIGALNLLPILLIDFPCLYVYKLGKYLDGDFSKSGSNQEKNSCKEKGESKNDGNNGNNDNNNIKGIGNNNLKSVKS